MTPRRKAPLDQGRQGGKAVRLQRSQAFRLTAPVYNEEQGHDLSRGSGAGRGRGICCGDDDGGPKRATFRSIALDAPDWWSPVPPAVATAVDVFDRRHAALSARAAAALSGAAIGGRPIETAACFEAALIDVRRHKYVLPEKAQRLQKIAARRPRTAPAKRAWRLEDSIWAPRQRYSDSKAFYDTPVLLRRMFEKDWARALDANKKSLIKFILRHDDDGEVDEDGDGIPDEVQEAAEAVWSVQKRLYSIFDFYASMGEKDAYSVTQNAFTLLVTDVGLHDDRSQFCTKKHLDQLFFTVNAGGSEAFNLKTALNRQEFLQVVVRVAVAKYVLTGQTQDVSEAIERIVQHDFSEQLPPECVHDANTFRRHHCYTEEVDTEFRLHEASLRVLYERYCRGSGGLSVATSTKLLDLGEWNRFVTDFGLIDSVLTTRLATLMFVWSRMRVADEAGARVALTHLYFEDFLEALVRVACLKPWPTPQEVRSAGCLDAGHFLIELQAESPQLYDDWCGERRRPWHAPEPAQPAAMCVRHLLSLLLRTIEASTPSQGAHDMRVTEIEVKYFYALQSRVPFDVLLERINKKAAAMARKEGRAELVRASTAGALVRSNTRPSVEITAALGGSFERALPSSAGGLARSRSSCGSRSCR